MAKRLSGEVSWFSNQRGYGFLVEEGKPDIQYFIHFSSIVMEGYKTLKAGQKVTFELKKTDKGTQAIDVQPA